MPAEIIDLESQAVGGGCSKNGGLQYSWVVEAKFVSAITVTAEAISNFTMTDVGKWAKYTPDKDGTANFAEAANRSGGKRSYNQTTLWKFGGVNTAYKKAIKNATLTCDVIAIHVYTNGARVVQGIEVDSTQTGGYSLSKIQQTLLQANQNSGTTSEESRHEVSMVGEASELATPCTLTDTAIEAL